MARVLRLAIWIAATLLAAGLMLWLTGAAAAAPILHAGLWVLIAVPIASVLTALAGYVGDRDWTFVALTAIVLACLVFPVARYFVSVPR